jgi:hypothetical protein
MNIIRNLEYLLKQSLFNKIQINLIFVHSNNPALLFERNEQMKNKIYEKLKIFNDEINGYLLDMEDFQFIYQCIEKQMIFLNFIDFKLHNHLEPDVDLAILQALLNGNQNIFTII